ncbi:class I SAM-dependent methyltransferase [Marinicella meishanensis]|uniref:class I SAM-dependent methyltransferase n=1 Tax=Marinicella meishanensis TaxID=2873263 RepID=UPI001CC09F5B|nr:class I SAM-dependent methyltransferase [Marinicella sp. NBU2979]
MNKQDKSPISRVNNYIGNLTKEQIENKHHRDKIGGFWEELGQLQMDFMKAKGLRAEHRLLDIGCGCLRGGLKFIDYLQAGHYHGSDINESLIEAGKIEVAEANLQDKMPQLQVSNCFGFGEFNTTFDRMIAFSLFTHLHMNLILQCLKHAHQCLHDDGRFYATFFIAQEDVQERPVDDTPGNIITHFEMDPFHYSMAEIQMMAQHIGFQAAHEPSFDHPRGQSMVCFTKSV